MREVWIVSDYQVRGVYGSLEKAKTLFHKYEDVIFARESKYIYRVFVGEELYPSFTIFRFEVEE